MDVKAFFEQRARENREELERAEREAIASGKEPFDLAKFEQLYLRGPQTQREERHRAGYYIFHRELKTLAAYVALLHEIEPWEDSN
jgi:hypothetical protein